MVLKLILFSCRHLIYDLLIVMIAKKRTPLFRHIEVQSLYNVHNVQQSRFSVITTGARCIVVNEVSTLTFALLIYLPDWLYVGYGRNDAKVF